VLRGLNKISEGRIKPENLRQAAQAIGKREITSAPALQCEDVFSDIENLDNF
jgi:hypothetical protein